jgi:hypothetical protein
VKIVLGLGLHDGKLESGVIRGDQFLAESVIARSYRDNFNIGSLRKFNTHAAPGTILKSSVEGDEVFTHPWYGASLGGSKNL